MGSRANTIVPLMRAKHPVISVITTDEEHAVHHARNAALDLGLSTWQWSAVQGLRQGDFTNNSSIEKTEDPAAALYHLAQQPGPLVYILLDLAPHFENNHLAIRAWRELAHAADRTGGHVVMIDHTPAAPRIVDSYAVKVEVPYPDDEEIHAIIKNTLKRFHRERPIEIDLTRNQMDAMIRHMRGLSRRQVERIIADCVASDRRFDAEDLNKIINEKRSLLADSGVLEHIEAPATLKDIGGLRRLKGWLEARRKAFEPDAKDFGIDPPRGVLMLGVQGTGKSLTAKAVAAAWERPLLRLDPGRLYNKYIGESEATLRRTLAQAEAMAPVVLWIDEIEKGFAAVGGASSNDGGLSKRMFGTMLTWMNDHTSAVFTIATANDIDALPPELLRKGRFDEIFFVDLPAPDVRRDVFIIHLRKRQRDPANFDLAKLVDASQGFSPAEIEQAVVGALHKTFEKKEDLTTEHIVAVLEESPPLSVTAAEKVRGLQEWAQGRCVPAD